mgnify:CR=1 FL=1
MAVNWNWNSKMGVITCKNNEGKKYKVNLYQANCLGALIYEFKEDGKNMYCFHGFWNDKKKIKNLLGLTKKYKDNIYKDYVVKISLNTFYKDTFKIAELFAKANMKQICFTNL